MKAEKGNRLLKGSSLFVHSSDSALGAWRVADAAGIRGRRRWRRLRIGRRLGSIRSRHRRLSWGSLVGNADGRAGDNHLHATVLFAAVGSAVVRHRIGHAVADSADVLR